MHTITGKNLLLLRPSDIILSRERARTRFDEYELHTLSSNILSNGILEPICVRQDGKDRYILICGERRLKAAKMAGLRRVPCVVHKTDEKTATVYALAENLSRSPLDFFEQAKAIERLIFAFNMTKSDISAKLGISQLSLSDKLSLLKIPQDKQDRILSANLTEAHAIQLSKLDKKDLSLILDAVISERLSVKQTEELIRSVNSPEEKEEICKEPIRKSAIGDVKLFSNSLTKLLLTMQNSGVKTSLVRRETEEFVEYKIRIDKGPDRQLSFSGI